MTALRIQEVATRYRVAPETLAPDEVAIVLGIARFHARHGVGACGMTLRILAALGLALFFLGLFLGHATAQT